MSIITLTSDWGASDFYVGAVKGKILSGSKSSVIIDISHSVQAFNTMQAAFIIRNAYSNFPSGSIHLIFVNTEPGPERSYMIVKANGHYFIGTDNGIFSLIVGEQAEKIVRLKSDNSNSWSVFDIFTNAACKLSDGIEIEKLGDISSSFNIRMPLRPTIEDAILTGSVIFIDSYQNAVTNISKDLFEKVKSDRTFDIYVQSKHYKISEISNFYHEVPVGELVAVFNSVGLLEIAINNGNAARLLNLDTNSTVRVEFKERKK